VSVARAHDLRAATHAHGFADAGRAGREHALGAVTLLTLVTMGVELAAGWWSGSLALTADGWHMGTHALAIGGAWLAMRWAARVEVQGTHHRTRGTDTAALYTFGGWKIEVLSAYTSGLALLVVAAWLLVDGIARLLAPQPVAFVPALVVAVIGLVVNLASAAVLLRGQKSAAGDAPGPGRGQGRAHDHENHREHDDTHVGEHGHGHDHGHDHGHGHEPAHGHAHDHNFNAAYLHVLADAFTSVLAIAALAGGAMFGWLWLDAAVALVGAAVIGQWSIGVLKGTARALVDATADPRLAARIRTLIESDGDATIADLHVWQVGGRAWCAALAVVADEPQPAAAYRERLAGIPVLRHVTVEVHRCPGCDAGAAAPGPSSAPSSPPRSDPASRPHGHPT
jgi:cation diffusion facilitator family transporter